MPQADKAIPVLSLVVAALAVFISPLVSFFISRRQIKNSLELNQRQTDSSLAVANKQIVAPMRQKWINDLRDLIAELASDSLHYFRAGHDFEGYKNFQRLTFLESKIQLMLNPNEEDHQKLEWMIAEMLKALQSGGEQGRADFIATHPEVMKFSRQVFKREWNRVKENIEISN
jgi:uncharacterized protein YneF (UPF0154 family)